MRREEALHLYFNNVKIEQYKGARHEQYMICSRAKCGDIISPDAFPGATAFPPIVDFMLAS
jgi:hypothetical protein